MVNDKILLAREERRNILSTLTKSSDAVTLKANIPGENKNLIEANLLVNYFIKKISSFPLSLSEIIKSEDGTVAFFTTDKGEEIKKECVFIEENHPLGRLIDIDVTLKGQRESLSRGKMRRCFLCANPAFVCGREKRHTTSELLRFFADKTNEHISSIIEEVIEESMLKELNLENKFGLVCPSTNGAHQDLNYSIMKGAISVIKKPLAKAFFLGLRGEDINSIMQKLIPLGILCEEEMKKVTFNSNAYKGFIFVGGLLLASIGYVIKTDGCASDIYKNAGRIVESYAFPTNTFGAKAFKGGFGGVREEARKGFPSVKLVEEYLENNSLHSALIFALKNLEDSVLYTRAKSEERYNYFKNLITNSHGREGEVSAYCIENNISIGGSADVLIASVMVKKNKGNFLF